MVEFNAEWYGRLVKNTDEKAVLVSRMSDLIGDGPYKSCLEIGLGISPYFATVLADRFGKYSIVERRHVDIKMPNNVELINNDWEQSDIGFKPDIIIASLVIYYFENKKAAIEKMFDSLDDNGKVYFVVNGKEGDYGPLKHAFSGMIGSEYHFTYDELIELLGDIEFKEYTVHSEIKFSSYEDLFETLKIAFDNYPEGYQRLRNEMIGYLKENVTGDSFTTHQKIIEVRKQ